jgi:hypothetical protein
MERDGVRPATPFGEKIRGTDVDSVPLRMRRHTRYLVLSALAFFVTTGSVSSSAAIFVRIVVHIRLVRVMSGDFRP